MFNSYAVMEEYGYASQVGGDHNFNLKSNKNQGHFHQNKYLIPQMHATNQTDFGAYERTRVNKA